MKYYEIVVHRFLCLLHTNFPSDVENMGFPVNFRKTFTLLRETDRSSIAGTVFILEWTHVTTAYFECEA